MPIGSEYGSGRRSVYNPTNGCRMEAVIWKASVMSPTWVKLSPKCSFSSGYTAGMTAWIVSLSRWERLAASRIASARVSRAAGKAGTVDGATGTKTERGMTPAT